MTPRCSRHCLAHGGIIMERHRGGQSELRRWWGFVVYITSRRRTVRLGSLQGVYERFPIKTKQVNRQQPHRRECTAEGPSIVYFLHGLAWISAVPDITQRIPRQRSAWLSDVMVRIHFGLDSFLKCLFMYFCMTTEYAEATSCHPFNRQFIIF